MSQKDWHITVGGVNIGISLCEELILHLYHQKDFSRFQKNLHGSVGDDLTRYLIVKSPLRVCQLERFS